jgi:hypothetical protein
MIRLCPSEGIDETFRMDRRLRPLRPVTFCLVGRGYIVRVTNVGLGPVRHYCGVRDIVGPQNSSLVLFVDTS